MIFSPPSRPPWFTSLVAATPGVFAVRDQAVDPLTPARVNALANSFDVWVDAGNLGHAQVFACSERGQLTVRVPRPDSPITGDGVYAWPDLSEVVTWWVDL
jgi:hypothetical protein